MKTCLLLELGGIRYHPVTTGGSILGCTAGLVSIIYQHAGLSTNSSLILVTCRTRSTPSRPLEFQNLLGARFLQRPRRAILTHHPPGAPAPGFVSDR